MTTTVCDKPQKFLHDLSTLPIYPQPSKQLNTAQCVIILLDPELSSDSLCTCVPFNINAIVILCMLLIRVAW